MDGVSFPLIPSDVKAWLKRGFEEDEITEALKECEGDKAPGPDDFDFNFTKAGWQFLKKGFFNMLHEFHRRGRLNQELNATFLTFIPKFRTQWS